MTTSEEPLRRGIEALSRFFVGRSSLSDTLTAVSQLACDSLGADMAGITLIVDGVPATGVFTDPEVPDIDTAQYSVGRGPCLQAFRQQTAILIDDTSVDDRWPQFAATASRHGIRTTLSLPLIPSDEPLGALNLYSRVLGTFDRDPMDAELLASQAAVVLANASAYHEARELNENLRYALGTRSTIDQAVGILLARGGHTPDEAFQVLVRVSQRENRKLRDIAADLVTRAQQPRPPPPGGARQT